MKKFLSGILAAAVVAVVVVPAGAVDDAKPEVTCAGAFASDAPDDSAGAANTELKEAFFKYGADGEVTANIRVANLNQDVDPASTGTNWYVVYQVGNEVRYVGAAIDFSGTISYEHGTYATNTYSGEGETTGKFFEGADGIIQIVVPGATEGSELGGPYATVSTAYVALLLTDDRAPDEGNGTSFTVAPCSGAAPPAPAPGSGGVAGAQNKSGPGLGVKVSPSKVSAKKSGKGKKLKFTLKSADELKNLALRLVQGKKVIASGKLSKLNGTGKATLKVKAKPKKGKATLQIAATDAKGLRRQGAYKIKVTK